MLFSTASTMATRPNQSIEVPTYYANLLDADVVAGVDTTHTLAGVVRPARRLIVGSIGAAGVTLTLPDGTATCVVSRAQLIACGGVLWRQFVRLQSANSTDISVDY